MNPAQQQMEDARRALYDLDPVDGSIISSKLYKMCEKNAADYYHTFLIPELKLTAVHKIKHKGEILWQW